MKHVEGPLDVIHRLDGDIAVLEDLVEVYYDFDESIDAEIVELTEEINRQHPAMHQPVFAYGTVLTPAMGKDFTMQTLSLSEQDMDPSERTLSQGYYRGLGIRPIWSVDQDATGYVLTHILESEPHEYFDEYCNRNTKSYISHIWAFDADVLPVLPVNSHSFQELENDRVVEAFNKYAYGEHELPEIVQRLGFIANAALCNDEALWDRSRQRISYLNSLDILSGVALDTRDVVVGDRDAYLGGDEIDFSSGEQQFTLIANQFDFLPGYIRGADNVPQLGLPPELFASVRLNDGTPLLVPMKNVDHVRPLSSLHELQTLT